MDIADFNHLFYRQVPTQNADDHIADIADELHHGLHDAGEKLRLPGAVGQLFVDLVEALDRVILAVESLNDGVPAIHLFPHARSYGQANLVAP